jgi:threonylcarbamoyladenosine tRNA methylthiotransferase MtaB
LLRILLENTEKIALRLSSIEPQPALLGDEFFQVISHPRIRPHFHLSVQSGSGAVLAAMARPYTAPDICKTAERLRALKDDPFLGCDIITGFPGEGEGDFEKTLELCRVLDFAAIHGFPFSRRGGTAAAEMKGQISQGTAGKRLALLLELSRRGREAYIRRWRGKTVEGVAESDRKSWPSARPAGRKAPEKSDLSSLFFPVLTDNYIRLLVSVNAGNMRPKPGSALRCRIREGAPQKDFDAWGEWL